MPALHNALIVSSHPRWLAASGLADILPWFSLAGHEVSRLAAAPADCSGYAVAIIRLAPGETALDSWQWRSEEHTSELQSLMRISYAVFCLKKTKSTTQNQPKNI